AVGVGVDHVRVHEVRPLRVERANDAAREQRRDIEAARDALPGNPPLVECAMESLGVTARIERKETGVDAALAQCREECEQMLLATADSAHLRHVNDSHRSRALWYTASVSSTIRPVEKRSRIRAEPASPSRRRNSGSSRSSRKRRASSPTSPIAAR